MALLLLILIILFLCSSYSEPYRPYIYVAIGALVLWGFISGFVKARKEQKLEKARKKAINAAEKAQIETINYQTVLTKMATRPTAPGAEERVDEAHEKWSAAMDEFTDAYNKYNKMKDS